MNAALKNTTAYTVFIPPRDFVMNPPWMNDRITFNTPDDGVLAGFIAAIRHHLGNGERFAWVELDNELAGQFRGVPLADIISSDDSGGARQQAAIVNSARRLCLADFSGALADQLRAVRERHETGLA
nr:hypothetical protein [Herbaspirillum sp. ASV7]